MTPGTCPAFYPVGYNGVLHRTEPELNAFVKRYLKQEMLWLKWRAEKMSKKGEDYIMLVRGEKNPEKDPAQNKEAGKYRGHITLRLKSERKSGQWVYPITILFNGGCTDSNPKSLIEVPINTGFSYKHLDEQIRSALGTRKYLMAKRSQRLAIADFLDRFLSND